MSNGNLPNIAFVGIGLMGLPMAARLVQAGYPLSAWNRTREKALPLAGYGANVADTLADAVRSADIVITMLEAGRSSNVLSKPCCRTCVPERWSST